MRQTPATCSTVKGMQFSCSDVHANKYNATTLLANTFDELVDKPTGSQGVCM